MNDEHRPEESPTAAPPRPAWVGWLVFGVIAVAIFLLALLFASVVQRRQEALIRPPLMPIDRFETDSSRWAVNWPREYASYKQMAGEPTETKYGGSYPRDYLDITPANVILFSGYGFAKEYLQARGHIHAVRDVLATKRIGARTPATCFTCKSPDVPRLMAEFGAKELNDPDAPLSELALAGAGEFYAKSFDEIKGEIQHPIGCLDCHDPKTMRLRISRPALIEAFQRQGRDITQVSHQEMRTLVCAQCHVEYYFQGKDNYLTFPWDKGTTPEEMEAYYAEYDFADWTHAVSKAPMVKMQHPDYEVYRTGIHAYLDVSCADCHMPYRTEGGVKYTDHHVQSPLLNIANSCAVCHRWGEQEILARVEGIQDKVQEARSRAEAALVRAHFDIAAAAEAGAADETLVEPRDLVRKAQLRWDYVSAHNGMGFHSPQECMRILGASVDLAQQCRLECSRILARQGYTEPVRYPDFSTKEKVQMLNQRFIEGSPPKLLAPDRS